MRREVIDKAKAELVQRREELIQLMYSNGGGETELIEERWPDLADVSSAQELAGYLERLSENEQRELREIIAAFVRLEAGRYGRCELCGRPIEERRLLAYPAVDTCERCGAGKQNEQDRLRPARRSMNAHGALLEDVRPELGLPMTELPPRHTPANEKLTSAAAEEPRIAEPWRPDEGEITARPNEKGGRMADRSLSLDPDDLGGYFIEEATEIQVQDGADAEPVPEQLVTLPREEAPEESEEEEQA